MALSYSVNNQDIVDLFKKIDDKLKKNPEQACFILQDLREIARAFAPDEISQASNFQTKYLERKRSLLCDQFSRYNAEIMRAIEQIICPESYKPEQRNRSTTSAKLLISNF